MQASTNVVKDDSYILTQVGLIALLDKLIGSVNDGRVSSSLPMCIVQYGL